MNENQLLVGAALCHLEKEKKGHVVELYYECSRLIVRSMCSLSIVRLVHKLRAGLAAMSYGDELLG